MGELVFVDSKATGDMDKVPDAVKQALSSQSGPIPKVALSDATGSKVYGTASHTELKGGLEKAMKDAKRALKADMAGGTAPKARRPAGVVADPKPLYPTDEAPKAKDIKPAALDKLKPGDAIPSAAGPQVGGKAFTLTCQVETELRDTVIVAHGGNSAGYALHLKEGRVVFVIRTSKDAMTEVQSEPTKGAVRVTAKLGEDGTMTLTVGDQAAVTGKARGVIPRQPQEDFCLGHDNGQPVATYSKGKPFEGKITELKVTTP